MTRAAVLSVNASDPTGYDGLDADLRTFAAHDLHGASIVSAVGGPSEHFPMPGNVVGGQLSMALAEFKPAATKVGLIATAEIAAAVGQRMRSGELKNVVLDPVLDAGGGHRRGVVGALLRLLPDAAIVTPNIDEAGELVGYPVNSTTDMAGAAAQLITKGAKCVVITGGRLSGDESVDAIWTDGGVRFLHAPRVETVNVRGTGSSFSAAIAAALALGADVHEAVNSAKAYVSKALAGSRDWTIGHHARPLDNLCLTAGRPGSQFALPAARRPPEQVSGPPMLGKRSGLTLPAA